MSDRLKRLDDELIAEQYERSQRTTKFYTRESGRIREITLELEPGSDDALTTGNAVHGRIVASRLYEQD